MVTDTLADTGHLIGATYMSLYWKKEYTVLAVTHVLGGTDNGVTVLWEDGYTTSHCTPVGDDPMTRSPRD